MRQKILTVDDSQMVRLIIKKAFAHLDCEVAEARDGLEGLAVAAQLVPDLILLDLTMPVMDGTAMLAHLRADPNLKAIPVVVLTAEGGRDNVLILAKLGVKGYVVKPFKDAALLEKVGRILELQPRAELPAKQRNAHDPVKILLVEDKPAIVQQIRQALASTNWILHATTGHRDAVEASALFAPDIIVISLTLADGSAYNLFRSLRTQVGTRSTPIIALFVKSDQVSQARAQEMGFTTTLTKPIDAMDLHRRVVHALHFDTFRSFFEIEAEALVVRLPVTCSAFVLQNAATHLGTKLTESLDAGVSRLVLDLGALRTLPMGVVKFMVETEKTCTDLGMKVALVGGPQLATECQALVETRHWVFHDTLELARVALFGPTPVGSLVGG